MPEFFSPYEGITLITAEDKTPKAQRVGNYYVKMENKSAAGIKYTNLITIEQYNSKRSKMMW